MRKCAEKSRSEAAGWMERGGIFALCRQGGRERRSVRRPKGRAARGAAGVSPTARRRRRAEVTLCAPSEGPHGEAAAGKRDGIYALASRRGRHPVCRLGAPVWRRSPHQTDNSPPPRGGAGGRWRVLSGGALPRRVGWRKAQKRGCPLGPRGLWRQPRSGRENGPSTH